MLAFYVYSYYALTNIDLILYI